MATHNVANPYLLRIDSWDHLSNPPMARIVWVDETVSWVPAVYVMANFPMAAGEYLEWARTHPPSSSKEAFVAGSSVRPAGDIKTKKAGAKAKVQNKDKGTHSAEASQVPSGAEARAKGKAQQSKPRYG